MRCPYCKQDADQVIESRSLRDASAVRRRRECTRCGRRYTTYERVEASPLHVIKKSGAREPFARGKILEGLYKACEKRPVSRARLDEVADKIELELYEAFERDVPSSHVGEVVMRELRVLDQVAYVRFASVYRQFKDVGEFMAELQPMLGQDPGRAAGP